VITNKYAIGEPLAVELSKRMQRSELFYRRTRVKQIWIMFINSTIHST